MKNGTKLFDFVTLLVTYLLVKVVHKLAGFQYDLFSQDFFSGELLMDVVSWVVVYTIVRFTLGLLFSAKKPIG